MNFAIIVKYLEETKVMNSPINVVDLYFLKIKLSRKCSSVVLEIFVSKSDFTLSGL